MMDIHVGSGVLIDRQLVRVEAVGRHCREVVDLWRQHGWIEHGEIRAEGVGHVDDSQPGTGE